MKQADKDLLEDRKVKGWNFEYDKIDSYYSCRGGVEYDEDHDARPENDLIVAAMLLESELIIEGFKVDFDEGEKGWVYITIQR